MNGRVYYNEFEPRTAAWLRQLIADGHLPAGDVDERSIEDVVPSDLRGYRQCHFFAGIGGWPLALALAGWPLDKPVWTGSCPCQPFSTAGARAGFADERHLWPAWQHLIAQCRPPTIFGEQVASAAGHGWIDLVQSDLEGQGYAVGHHVLGAHSVGAPHIRQRLWFVAHAVGAGPLHSAEPGAHRAREGGRTRHVDPPGSGDSRDLAHADSRRREAVQQYGEVVRARNEQGRGWHQSAAAFGHNGELGGLAHTDGGTGGQGRAIDGGRYSGGYAQQGAGLGGSVAPDGGRPGPLHGFWRATDWLLCRDGKWRPVEPRAFPLAHGVPARVVRLRGYGNAIVPQVAAEFIVACKEAWGG